MFFPVFLKISVFISLIVYIVFRSCGYQCFDVLDDANWGNVVSQYVIAVHFEDIDLFCVLQEWARLLTDIAETDRTAPVAEEKGGVTTVVDK